MVLAKDEMEGLVLSSMQAYVECEYETEKTLCEDLSA